MVLFTDVVALIPTLRGHLSAHAGVSEAQAVMTELTDPEVLAILQESAELCRQAEQIRLVAAGIVAARSAREAGHSGLSQSRGHRSPVSLVQEITGSTKSEAARSVRVGESLLEAPGAADADAGDGGASTGAGGAGVGAGGAGVDDPNVADGSAAFSSTATPVVWHEPLRRALRDGSLSSAQFDVIRRGLGEPPVRAGDDESVVRAAWTEAAEHLVMEAAHRTVEELGAAARTIRDLLDSEGAQERFLARFEKRSFRTYLDQDGMRRATMVLDDEGGAFLHSLIDAAMRPRRGGPRFVDADEKARAAELAEDPRTNEQLTYDLVLDVLRAGALADPGAVFGTRQAGVRLVQVVDATGQQAPVAHTEDGLIALPAAAAAQRVCDSGTVQVTVDGCGNPLDAGREQRLFTPKQRVALAIRDGGCRWRGCDRPASYCEAHHIDPWAAENGRTDIDRGILLCRFHHMQLHHGRWRITREGKSDFVLHHPQGKSFTLHARAALTYAWAGIDPPPKRFRPAA